MDERYGRRYDDERRFGDAPSREYEGRRYRGEGYYAEGAYGRRGHPEDRGFLDRAGDELRSWFGDEEAERRRREDEREARRSGWRPGGRDREGWSASRDRERWGERERERGGPDYPDERTWARQWGYVEDPYERGGTFGERQPGWGTSYGTGPTMPDEGFIARGPYAGRGPRGYQRSDERIREDICDRLCAHGAVDASNVEVQVIATEVTLLGTVPTRWQKRLTEDIVDSVSGVNEVHNQLRVSPGGATQPTGTNPVPGMPTAPPGSGPAAPTDWRNRAA